MNPNSLVAKIDKFDQFNPKVTMSYKLITPQNNTQKYPYVCHVTMYNDMGHVRPFLKWENGVKPEGVEKYEDNIKEIVYRYWDNFIEDVFIKGENSGVVIRSYKAKNKNKWLNIMRFYLNYDTFVRVDFN